MNTLTKFLSERPAINLREFCKEADVSYSLASKIRVGQMPETQETRDKLRPTMFKYGWFGGFDMDSIVCKYFYPESNTTSATRCRFCGKEQWEHV